MASFATPQRQPLKPAHQRAASVATERAAHVVAALPDREPPARGAHDLADRGPVTPVPVFAPGAREAADAAVQRKQSSAPAMPRVFAVAPIQRKNSTGLPDALKEGVEALSGVALDDVRVHYNSAKPAAVQASAYAQGTEIHVGPGQERHLPHEAWHVVQQKHGRVAPTMQVNGVAVNDDVSLEREADQMGSSALRTRGPVQLKADPIARGMPHGPVIQRDHTDTGLKKDTAISTFAGKVKARATGGKNPLGSTKQWATLDAAAKIAKVAKYVNAELKKTHVPEVGAAPDAGSRFDGAQFDFRTWTVEIGSQGLDAPMTDADVGEMADTVYHECRHAEQWFRMARLKAGEAPEPTAADLARSLAIPLAIATAALARPLKPLTKLQKALHSKKYAERHQNKMDEANAWHAGIYGAGGAHRGAVLNDINNRHAEYLQLVEEVDAWGVGGTAKGKVNALLQEERQRTAALVGGGA